MVIGIIGGGASGMTAAITAAEMPNVQVHVFERQARVGKKLLATGNGRCNLTNLHVSPSGYHGEDVSFAEYALNAFAVNETLKWFEKLGLFTVAEESGRVYPYSDQANSVVDVLRFALEKPNITVHTAFEVKRVRHSADGFTVEGDGEIYTCDRLIVACGGLAGTKLGGSMSGYKLLNQFGHRTSRLRPALVQLKSAWSGVSALKGVRTNCHIAIWKGGAKFSESSGEIQFTDYGISGPVVFEVSRDACSGPEQSLAMIDFMPDHSEEELFRVLCRRKETGLSAENLLTGMLHNRLGRVLTAAVGIKGHLPVSALTEDVLKALSHRIKNFELELTEPMGMDCAQVTAGGVLTGEFDPKTMESKLVAGLYACGEVLDIDGDCGGYNLQWAWSSGHLAGHSAGKDEA